MHKHLFLVVFGLVLLSPLVVSHEGHDHDHEEEEPEDSDVVVLGDDNFDVTINSNEFVFVEFYAPWCGHCKRLAPEYDIVATALKEEGSKTIIAKVDATLNEATAIKYDIRGYPTLKLFRNGNAIDYDGGRTAGEIIQWIKKKSGPPTTLLSTKEELKAFIDHTGTKIVAFLSSEKSISEWTAAASSGRLEDFSLGHVTESSIFGDHKVNTIVVFKQSEAPIVYSGEIDKEAIVSWILVEAYPLFEDLTQVIWLRSQSTESPLLAIFVKSLEENEELIAHVASKLKGKVLTSYSANIQFAERWGATGRVIPTAVFISWSGNEPKLTIYDEEGPALTSETVLDFVTKSIAGEYQTYRKSAPVPESNDDPVKIIVGKNFEEIVRDKNKDVFVEFYAPWCGHCKKLAPVWDELGQSFSDVPTVVIGKMDATANTPPSDIEISGFPTLVFFPADNKAGLVYNGDRDLDSLKKYVQDHASYSIKQDL